MFFTFRNSKMGMHGQRVYTCVCAFFFRVSSPSPMTDDDDDDDNKLTNNKMPTRLDNYLHNKMYQFEIRMATRNQISKRTNAQQQ